MHSKSTVPQRLRRVFSTLGNNKQLHLLGLRERLFLTQLPLNVGAVLAVGVLALTNPAALTDAGFLTGVLIIALVTVAALGVPWERLPPVAYWVLPCADLLAVGFLHAANDGGTAWLAVMTIFPVFWLAWSGISMRAARAISFAGPLLIVWYPLFNEGIVSAATLAAPFLWPMANYGLAVAVSMIDSSGADRRATSDSQALELQRALQESSQREQLLDTILNTVNMAVMAIDLQGATLLGNAPQNENHLRASRAGVITDREEDLEIFAADKITLMPNEDRPMARARRGESFTDLLAWIGHDEHQRAISSSARPIRNDDGVRQGAVVVANDVTALVNALAAKDAFVANVSHELRTPLTSIIGYLDLVLEDADALPAGAATALGTVAKNSEKLLKLVSDLLTTAADDPQVQPVPTDLAALIRGSVEMAAPKAAAEGVSVAVELPAQLNATVDPHRMGQVLDNLISNAIKYSPGGNVNVRVEAGPLGIRIDISDTGIGIAAADQEEVFAKFFRARSSLTSTVPGVGLGLAITKGIVEAHGGTISVLSQVGEGSTFTVSLPTNRGVGYRNVVELDSPASEPAGALSAVSGQP
ncbi:sensor histidine kinase [Arthrobacter sp. Sr24]